jgi:hypothetical protein
MAQKIKFMTLRGEKLLTAGGDIYEYSLKEAHDED